MRGGTTKDTRYVLGAGRGRKLKNEKGNHPTRNTTLNEKLNTAPRKILRVPQADSVDLGSQGGRGRRGGDSFLQLGKRGHPPIKDKIQGDEGELPFTLSFLMNVNLKSHGLFQ